MKLISNIPPNFIMDVITYPSCDSSQSTFAKGSFGWIFLILDDKTWVTVIQGTMSNIFHEIETSHQRVYFTTLQRRHNRRHCISNHQLHDCLLNRSFRRRPKKTPKFRITGLCEGNSPVTGEFPAQKASNAENVSISWRHHESVNWILFISGHGYKLLYVHKLEHLYYVHNIPLWAICFFNWDCDIDFCEQRFSSSVV